MRILTGRGAIVRAAVAVLIAAAAATPGTAQELGFYHASGISSLRELEHANGVGAYFLLHMPGLSLLGNAYAHSNTVPVTTRMCSSLTPPANCVEREMERETRLRGLSVSALAPVVGRRVRLELGGGLSFNVVTAEDHGAPDARRSALWTQPTGQLGLLTTVALRARPLATLPLVLHASAGNHHLRLTACGEYAGMDDPFCGSVNLRELRLGLGYDLRN